MFGWALFLVPRLLLLLPGSGGRATTQLERDEVVLVRRRCDWMTVRKKTRR